MPVSPSTCRTSRRPAPPASGCSAPNCSSWWRRPFRSACAAIAGHGGGLCRARAAARPPATAIPRAARQAVHDQGRPGDRADDQCRSRRRPAAHRGDRRRRHRVVPHRTAVHGGGDLSDRHVRPSPDMEAAYVERVRLRARRQLQYLALRDKPCMTRDGQAIELMINAGLAVDLPHIEETGAAGIGLFRTELQFMVAATFPRTAEQFSLYRAVLDAAGDKPVTFRTLDIGGDKVLPYMRNFEEENPALGWRAIRLGLDRPGLLRSQVRALLRAAGGRDLKVMFPMIATVEEFDEAKSLVERELTHLRR